MNLLDLLLIVAIVFAALGGYRAGFLARAATWVGVVVGFYGALRLLPLVLSSFELPTASGRLLVAVSVLVIGTFLGQAAGLVLGHRMRGVLPRGRARTADRIVGSFAGAFAILVALWLFLPTLADVAGWPARQARGSAMARAVNASFPEPPDATQAMRRLVDERGFPRVFEALEPAPDPGVPPVDAGLEPEVQLRVAASTVKVTGEGDDDSCRRIQEGSGFVISENVLVTNAHVVAGAERIEVTRPDGKRLVAAVAVFDPERDLSVLRVDKLGMPSLGRANASAGETGAVFGHPGGQEAVRAAPARISRELRASGFDIYGEAESERQVFVLAASLRSGDSGGPLVDREGSVVGVAFAIAPDRPGTAYALTGQELDATVRTFNDNPSAKVETGPCLN